MDDGIKEAEQVPTDDWAAVRDMFAKASAKLDEVIADAERLARTLAPRTRATLDFYGDDASEFGELTRGVDLGTLLRDALGEFMATREQVEAYVAKRYASHDEVFRSRKVREVTKRLRLAELLHRADITIEIENGDQR